MTDFRPDEPYRAADEPYRGEADVARADLEAGQRPDTMVLHAERLVAGTERVEHARGVIHTRVVTETIQVPVEVQREELVIEGLDGVVRVIDAVDAAGVAADPADGGTRTERGGFLSRLGLGSRTAADVEPEGTPTADEEMARIVLHAQRPVISVETVPVEEIIVRKVTHTRETQVTEEVRHEEVEVIRDGDVRLVEDGRA